MPGLHPGGHWFESNIPYNGSVARRSSVCLLSKWCKFDSYQIRMNPWNSKYKSLQGNIGLGQAIAWYTSQGIPVLLPLNDTQKYDLAIDIKGELQRVSIKTTQAQDARGNYIVGLRNTGGSSDKSVIRKFDPKSCDLLFIYTKSGDRYEIPAKDIDVNFLTLPGRWIDYKI